MRGRGQALHVAIVACGFTGTTAFYQLVHGYKVARITIFEASGDFGRGLYVSSAIMMANIVERILAVALTPSPE